MRENCMISLKISLVCTCRSGSFLLRDAFRHAYLMLVSIWLLQSKATSNYFSPEAIRLPPLPKKCPEVRHLMTEIQFPLLPGPLSPWVVFLSLSYMVKMICLKLLVFEILNDKKSLKLLKLSRWKYNRFICQCFKLLHLIHKLTWH